MQLDVALLRQAENSNHCGIACAGMFLDYYNLEYEFNSVLSGLSEQLDEIGLSAPRLGLYLMRNFDFSIEIITLNPFILSIAQIGKTQNEIYERIKIRRDMLLEKHDNEIANSFLEFMENGGKVIAQIPSFDHIKEEIDAGRPILASITSNFLFGNLRFNFHYNIVTGYDSQYIHVNDPNSDETGGKHKHKIDNFIYAIHSAAYGDVDNGCLIKILPSS